jgi:3',5'-cyclic AMP phosphodiesterase CpdA
MAGRLLAVSDLHIGYPENRAYADALSPGDPGDWLIVAGDVGEVFADVGFVLASLASRFAKVIWTPGNHELWTLPLVTPEDEFPVWDGPGGRPAALAAARRAGIAPADEGRLHADPYPSVAAWCRDQVLAAVYGHLHIPRTTHHDGVRFEEVSVGYPREWQRRGAAPPPPRVILGGEGSRG